MIYFLTRGFRPLKNGISYDMGIGHALFIKGRAKSGSLTPTDLPSLVRLSMKLLERLGIGVSSCWMCVT